MGTEAERLQAIHENMTTDPAVIEEIASWSTPDGEAVVVERITVGETNEVYEIKAAEPRILRINHATPDNFDREEWALDRARLQGLPVPTIVSRGVVSDQGQDRFYEVQEKLPGTPFAELIEQGMPEGDRRQITREAGAMLAQLHTVSTAGFGDLDAKGKGEQPTLQHWFSQITAKAALLEQAFRDHDRDPAVCAEAISLLDLSQPLFEGAPPHLVHDDFAPKHVLVSYDETGPYISGVIDFELAKSGYAGHELPEWELRHADTAPTQWLLEGYQSIRPLTSEDMQRQRIAALHKYLVLLDYYALEMPSVGQAYACFTAIERLVGATPPASAGIIKI